jgi:hypothetical protein
VIAAPTGAGAATTLARLADDAAAALRRAARGAPLELGVPDDRTGRTSSLASDLHALLQARLPAVAAGGRHVRVTSVLSQQPGRLVFSARLVEAPDGRLIDVVSVSMPTDGGDLSLASAPWAGAAGALDVVRQERSAPLPGPVLDLAFLGEHLLVLWPEEVGLYRWDQASLRLESRHVLAGPRRPVRTPGGLLWTSDREDAFWALTSRVPRATVFSVEGAGLSVASTAADSVPWPGVANGVRFRPGTNLVEGETGAVGAGPFLALDGDGALLVAVGADGMLLAPGGPDGARPRVGCCLAAPRPGTLVTTAPGPPGPRDALLFLDRQAPHAERARLPIDGTVRALAARPAGARSRVVAAVEGEGGDTTLLALEIGWP